MKSVSAFSLALALCQASLLETIAAGTNAFFVMDTALRDGKVRSPTEEAMLVKQLGFDGFGTSGYPEEKLLGAFKKEGLRVYNTYLTLNFDSASPELDQKLPVLLSRLKPHHTDLWISINVVTRDGARLKPSAAEGDIVVAPAIRQLADLAASNDLRLALYPHAGCWLERLQDSLRLAQAVNRSNVGVTFNLCHWLKVEGDRDPKPALEQALSHLFYVTISGADSGNTKAMNWDRLIQPLDTGSYDVAAMVRLLRQIGYAGPIGFQGYGIRGDSRVILARTMAAWRQMSSPEER